MKPTFLLIGAAKCGTTSLCALLGSHPDVYMARPKELNFFAYDELYARGPEWYEQHFLPGRHCQARGEGSPLYSLSTIYPDAPRRIAEYDRDLKLIYIVRHPLRRIEAGWLEMRSWGDERAAANFDEALVKNRNWLVDTSNYWNEVERYKACFPAEQILVLFFEDFLEDWRRALSTCFEFLGVDPAVDIDESQKHLNPSQHKRIRREGVSRLRTLPGFETAFALAKWVLPETLRAPVRHYVLNARVKARPVWGADSREWVVSQLRADTERFLASHGKPRDYWDLMRD